MFHNKSYYRNLIYRSIGINSITVVGGGATKSRVDFCLADCPTSSKRESETNKADKKSYDLTVIENITFEKQITCESTRMDEQVVVRYDNY